MSCVTYLEGDSWVHRLDPRGKILVAAVFSILLAVSEQSVVHLVGLFLALGLAAAARLPGNALGRRLLGLNIFMLIIWITMPLTMPGRVLYRVGPVAVSHEGIALACAITLKGNGIVLLGTALLSTSEMSRLGHALHHLHVPDKLAHLFLFTVRYIDVIHHEYEHLRKAMKARCFRPRMNSHSYRSFAYLVAMLLARSLDRSERIAQAMKCRGFKGRFYLADHFSLKRVDLVFGSVSSAILVGLIVVEWIWLPY